MKTYKLGESEMNERKVNFDFRHVQTIDHGNGMVTEIMACYMPTGTLLRFSDCIIDEDRNVHVIAVNYQLDPGITGAQMITDPSARIHPVANITNPYLEHEAQEGKIEYSEESSPMDSSVNPVPDEEEADGEDSDDDNELYISEQEQEKLNKLLNAGDDDEVSEETESDIKPVANEENSMILDGEDAPEPVESNIATFDDDDDDETGCVPEAPNPKKYEEKARKHYVNNNNQKQKWNNNKKNKGYDNRRDNRNNRPKENSSFENSLMNAISKGWN